MNIHFIYYWIIHLNSFDIFTFYICFCFILYVESGKRCVKMGGAIKGFDHGGNKNGFTYSNNR